MTRAVTSTAGIHFSSYKQDDKANGDDVGDDVMVAAAEDAPLPDFAAIRAQQEEALRNG